MSQRAGSTANTSDLGEPLFGVDPDGKYIRLQTDSAGNLKTTLVAQETDDDETMASDMYPTHETRNARRQQFVADYRTAEVLEEIYLVLTEIRDYLKRTD